MPRAAWWSSEGLQSDQQVQTPPSGSWKNANDANPIQLLFQLSQQRVHLCCLGQIVFFIRQRFFVSTEALCLDALSAISANSLTCCAFCDLNIIFEALKTQEEELQQAADKLRQAGSGVWIYKQVLRTNLGIFVVCDLQFWALGAMERFCLFCIWPGGKGHIEEPWWRNFGAQGQIHQTGGEFEGDFLPLVAWQIWNLNSIVLSTFFWFEHLMEAMSWKNQDMLLWPTHLSTTCSAQLHTTVQKASNQHRRSQIQKRYQSVANESRTRNISDDFLVLFRTMRKDRKAWKQGTCCTVVQRRCTCPGCTVAMTVAKLFALLVGCAGALSTLEEALANVASQVTNKFGKNFTLSLVTECQTNVKQMSNKCQTNVKQMSQSQIKNLQSPFCTTQVKQENLWSSSACYSPRFAWGGRPHRRLL